MKYLISNKLLFLYFGIMEMYCSTTISDPDLMVQIAYPEYGPTYIDSSLLLQCSHYNPPSIATDNYSILANNQDTNADNNSTVTKNSNSNNQSMVLQERNQHENQPTSNTSETSTNIANNSANTVHNSGSVINPTCKFLWTRTCVEDIDCELSIDAISLEMLPSFEAATILGSSNAGMKEERLISLLYIKSLDFTHAGLYTCHLQCNDHSSSDSVKVTPVPVIVDEVDGNESEGNVTAGGDSDEDEPIPNDTVPGPPGRSTTGNYNNVYDTTHQDNNFRVGLGAAVGVVLALIAAYMILIRSRMIGQSRRNRNAANANNNTSNKPPSYDEVLSNPDKYPMSQSNSNVAQLQQQGADIVHGTAADTQPQQQETVIQMGNMRVLQITIPDNVIALPSTRSEQTGSELEARPVQSDPGVSPQRATSTLLQLSKSRSLQDETRIQIGGASGSPRHPEATELYTITSHGVT